MSRKQWLTPEEQQRRKTIKQKMFYLSVPIIGAVIGGLITIMVNAM